MGKIYYKLISVLFLVLSIFIFTSCGMPDMELKTEKVEANKNETLLDLLNVDDEDNKYSIEAKNSNIDLGKCGKYAVTYVVKKNDKKIGSKKFSFKIVDTTSPIIYVDDNITVKRGSSKLDITKYADISDNSSDNLDIEVKGNYNLNVCDTYNITIIAKDSSGNESKAKTKMIVSEVDNNEDQSKTLSASASDIKGYWQNKGKDKLIIIQKENNKYSNLKIVISILSEGLNSETDGGSITNLTKKDDNYKITFINSQNIKITINAMLNSKDTLVIDSKYKSINGSYAKTTKDILK